MRERLNVEDEILLDDLSSKAKPNLEKPLFKPFKNLLKSFYKLAKKLVAKSSSREVFIASHKN